MRCGLIVLLFIGAEVGCVESQVTVCDNGIVCPAGARCSASYGCVLEKQVEACNGLADGATCTYSGITSGRCVEGACQALRCGDGSVTAPEECDGAITGTLADCQGHGFYMPGTVTCTDSCTFDLSSCSGYCGDGVINGNESCDPAMAGTVMDDVLGGKTCLDFGFYQSSGLICSSACTFVTNGCTHVCGDGVLDASEDCDDAGTATPSDDIFRGNCKSLGYYNTATIRCNARCGYDTSACTGYCGDGIINGSEDCDDHNTTSTADDVFAGTCKDLGFYNDTTLACTGSCNYDDSGCTGYCGDRNIDTTHQETCEEAGPPGQSCVQFGFESGALSCQRLCGADFGACSQPWTSMDAAPPGLLKGVWGSGPFDVFAVGDMGAIRHYNGAWSTMNSGTTQYLTAVWGSSPTNVFAVGNAGEIRHYTGSSWTQMSGTTHTLYGIWGSGPGDVFAVGDTGTIIHYNGATWSTMTSGTTTQLFAVWGSGPSDVFAVGLGGTVLHYTGASWSPMTSNTTSQLDGVWGSGASDVFAVGGGGTIVHYNGSTWTVQPTNASLVFRAIWGSGPNDVFAVGDGPTVHYDGATWSSLAPSSAISGQLAIWGNGPADIFVAGGNVAHWNGNTWFTMANAAPSLTSNRGVWGAAANDVFAVGDFGEIQRWNGSTWTAMTSNTGSNLVSISGSGPNDVFAVGTFGGLVRWNGGSWSPMSVTSDHIYGVWVASSTDAFIVGNAGLAYRWNGSSWSSMTTGTSTVLNGVWGTSSTDVWAVGNSGLILHWNGSAWSPVSSGTGQSLLAVWGANKNDVYAVGWFTIQHWDGTSWSTMSSPASPVWQGVSGTGPTDVFVVGTGGAIQHWDGSSWSAMVTPSPSTSLNGVWAGPDVFVAGGGQSIWRRSRRALQTELFCHDHTDDDLDGSIDCADSDCASDSNCSMGGLCQGATTITCNNSMMNTTVGGPSNIDRYDCDPAVELGREKIYRLTPGANATVTATLTGMAKDLDLVVLGEGAGGGCDTHRPGCLGASSTKANESVTFSATSGKDYYIVVDGYGAAAGAFTLGVTCQ